jgi:hypothetical protein
MLVTLSISGFPAFASPLRAKNGQSVRLMLSGQREVGIGLRPLRGAWKLDLLDAQGADSAEVVDVTAGAPASKWMMAVEAGALVFDGRRFMADHAYRVQLRRGNLPLGSALVYLYPAKMGAKSRVSFGDDETHPDDDDGIAVTPKSAL